MFYPWLCNAVFTLGTVYLSLKIWFSKMLWFLFPFFPFKWNPKIGAIANLHLHICAIMENSFFFFINSNIILDLWDFLRITVRFRGYLGNRVWGISEFPTSCHPAGFTNAEGPLSILKAVDILEFGNAKDSPGYPKFANQTGNPKSLSKIPNSLKQTGLWA